MGDFQDIESAVAAMGSVYNEQLYAPICYMDDYAADAMVHNVIMRAAVDSINSWRGAYMMMRAHRAADVAASWIAYHRLSPDLVSAKMEAVAIAQRWLVPNPKMFDPWNDGLERLIKDIEAIPAHQAEPTAS